MSELVCGLPHHQWCQWLEYNRPIPNQPHEADIILSFSQYQPVLCVSYQVCGLLSTMTKHQDWNFSASTSFRAVCGMLQTADQAGARSPLTLPAISAVTTTTRILSATTSPNSGSLKAPTLSSHRVTSSSSEGRSSLGRENAQTLSISDFGRPDLIRRCANRSAARLLGATSKSREWACFLNTWEDADKKNTQKWQMSMY